MPLLKRHSKYANDGVVKRVQNAGIRDDIRGGCHGKMSKSVDYAGRITLYHPYCLYDIE